MSARAFGASLAVGVALAGGSALAAPVQVRVTITNTGAANGPALAPFFVAAQDGTYDTFNAGAAATGSAIQSTAELGSPATQLADVASRSPGAVAGALLATSGGLPNGIFLPGATGSITLTFDPAVDRFFSFATMVVSSNDFFLGNDSPTAFPLFDAQGNFVAQTINLTGASVWDAGTEVNGAFGAAFIAGSNITDHVAENGVVTPVADFGVFNGLTTAAGYTFAGPASTGGVATISFAVVPEPGMAMWAVPAGAAMLGRRQRTAR